MKQVGKLLNIPQPGQPVYQSGEMTCRGEPTDADKQFINDLFARLAGIFPAWKAAFDGDDGIREAKRSWLNALVNNNITTMGQVNNGLRKAEKHDSPFLPSSGMFIAWCQPDPAEHGLPSLIDAWSEICRADAAMGGRYSHGIVLAARNDPRCDAYNWRMLPLDQGQRRFEPIYLEYVSRAMAGEQFEMPDMIEHKPAKPMNREDRVATASRYLGGLKSALRGQS